MESLKRVLLEALDLCDNEGYDLYFSNNSSKILLNYINIDYIINNWNNYGQIKLYNNKRNIFTIDSDCIYDFESYLNREKYLKQYKNMQKVLF